jgi:hypothetical protein
LWRNEVSKEIPDKFSISMYLKNNELLVKIFWKAESPERFGFGNGNEWLGKFLKRLK